MERLGIFYWQKKDPYPLVTILEDSISYKNKVIYLKTEPIQLQVEGWNIYISFNILLLGNDEAVLEIP